MLKDSEGPCFSWQMLPLKEAFVDPSSSHSSHPLASQSIDPREINLFRQTADQWWDEQGPYRLLHAMNPVRITWLVERMMTCFALDPQAPQPLQGLKILDVGCGGGLLSEPLARLGAQVTGIDATAENIQIAQEHALGQGLDIEFLYTSVEALGDSGRTFDVVIAMEIIEHVPDVKAFVAACTHMLTPHGMMALSTLNRTLPSYMLAIMAAEYLLGWVPKGTHTWQRFIRPRELKSILKAQGLHPEESTGFSYSPWQGAWKVAQSCAINYALAAYRQKKGIQQRFGETSS